MVAVIARHNQIETEDSLRRPRVPRTLAAGVIVGLILGIGARAWMRLISDEPEFSWSGTVFIVVAFTILGLTQAIAITGRGRAQRRWSRAVTRIVGAIGMLPIFAGAGAIMLPTVVGGGIAVWRTTWRPWARAVVAVMAIGPIALVTIGLVDKFGWSLRSLAGLVVLLMLYGAVVAAARTSFVRPVDGLRIPRLVIAPLVVVLFGLQLFLIAGVAFRDG
jgi:hypothetical protein